MNYKLGKHKPVMFKDVISKEEKTQKEWEVWANQNNGYLEEFGSKDHLLIRDNKTANLMVELLKVKNK
jgi:hypothetical protein